MNKGTKLIILIALISLLTVGIKQAFADITFETTNLDEDFYKFAIMGQILGQGYDNPLMIKDWDITIYPLNHTNIQFYQHVKLEDGQKLNPNIPSGVTGDYIMKLYLLDSEGLMQRRMNAHVIQHEMAHAILYQMYGTADNKWVDAVHNSEKTFQLRLIQPGKDPFVMNVTDIRDYLIKPERCYINQIRCNV